MRRRGDTKSRSRGHRRLFPKEHSKTVRQPVQFPLSENQLRGTVLGRIVNCPTGVRFLDEALNLSP